MASSTLLSFRPPLATRTYATSAGGEQRGRAGGRWWAPLFGWSPDPDYIDGGDAASSTSTSPPAERRRRYVAFTEEKARELRKRMMETETFHDAMYHSAIASRLATDLPRRSSIDGRD